MSRGGEVRLEFAGEERTFRLRIGELRQLQEACGDVGPMVVLDRLRSRSPMKWLVDDVRAPILFGLIGGGMSPAAAGRLVRRWLDDSADYVANVGVAMAVIIAAVMGPKSEPVEVPKTGEEEPPGKPAAGATAESPSPASTQPAR